jgi:hypothetical protein
LRADSQIWSGSKEQWRSLRNKVPSERRYIPAE